MSYDVDCKLDTREQTTTLQPHKPNAAVLESSCQRPQERPPATITVIALSTWLSTNALSMAVADAYAILAAVDSTTRSCSHMRAFQHASLVTVKLVAGEGGPAAHDELSLVIMVKITPKLRNQQSPD